MREQLVRHLDVVIVVWALALCVAWTFVALSHSPLGYNQGSGWTDIGADWVAAGSN